MFGSTFVLPDQALDVTRPPVRIAAWKLTPGTNPGESQAVLIVADGRGEPRSFAETAVTSPTPGQGQRDPRPQWDPRGRLLAYRDLATQGLFVLDTARGSLTQVSYGDHFPEVMEDSGLSWSPDGSRLLFSGILEDESTSTDYDEGSGPPQFTSEVLLYEVRTGEVTRLTHDRGNNRPLAWSPDGRRFLSHYDGVVGMGGEPNVYWRTLTVHDAQSGDSRALARGLVSGARWSPDGSRVMYSCLPPDPYLPWTSDICVTSVDGTDRRRLTPSNCEDCFLPRYSDETANWRSVFGGRWAPGGDRAIFTAYLWKADDVHEKSIQMHDFASDRGQLLISLTALDGAIRTVDFVGWLNDDEFLYESTYSCGEYTPSHGTASITKFTIDSAEAQVIVEIPEKPRAPDDGLIDCPPSVALSPDRSHLAVQYSLAGLHVYSLPSRSWTEIIDSWSSIGGTGTHSIARCVVPWTAAGFLGACDHVREVTNARNVAQ